MVLEALRPLISETLALQVATSSEDRRPYVARGLGVSLKGEELRVAVIQAQGVQLLATIQRTRRVAVNLTHPNTFLGRQVKGPLVAVDEPSEDAARVAAEYLERFARVIAGIGVTRQQAQGMFFSKSPVCWVRMRPQELFDQSPGTGAGRRL